MEYRGQHEIFDPSKVRTYPLRVRHSKVEIDSFVNVEALRGEPVRASGGPWFRDGQAGEPADQHPGLRELAQRIVACRRAGQPVAVLSGAHPIKNGYIPIIVDLIRRGMITIYSTNMAGAIHSFELALTGASSESVRDALPKGEFGMAFETGMYLNETMRVGLERGYGLGESMGHLYCDAEFRREVLDRALRGRADVSQYIQPYDGFPYADQNVFAAAYRQGIPACIHASMGTDITDQHANLDGQAKGGCSTADFLIFAEHMCRFTQGGVILNIGTAIMGPEVVLKAASMAANVGCKPDNLWTADFDLRPFGIDNQTRDESQFTYYFRDHKSIVMRIPQSFGGVGFYFQGAHGQTLPPLYQFILRELGE